MIILKYLECLITSPKEKMWVWDKCDELPWWDEGKKEYVFKKKPKRIDAKEAKELIKEHGLKCVCSNEYGRIYA